MNTLIIVLFGLTALYMSFTGRVESYARALAAQGFLLFFLLLSDFSHAEILDFILLSVETLLVKAIIIPVFLIYIIRKNNIHRETEPYIPNFYSLVAATAIFMFGFYMSSWPAHLSESIKPVYFGISVSTMITGLFIIMTRKKIITHVMGYMMLENGIFLLSLSVATKMPLIVELGVLLDIFMAIFLLGIFVEKINSSLEEPDIDTLTNLRY